MVLAFSFLFPVRKSASRNHLSVSGLAKFKVNVVVAAAAAVADDTEDHDDDDDDGVGCVC